ncbi:MAG: putative TetR family transcriptional regulator [Acidimicrobiales bacterium]|nr:putative TetR family transcriptional regulator [Acidimicrobiales bacterium]
MRDTKERLLAAGEKLFARDGVHRVTVRELNEVAGQRNASALHYHFGSRDGLLRAIIERHQQVVDADRARRLDALDDPTVHDLVELVLAPLAEQLRSPSGRDYLRIVPQLLNRDGLVPPALDRTMELLDERLDLPTDLKSERLRSVLLAAFTLLADRAGQRKPAVPHDRFVDNLVAMATGMLLA